MAYQIMVREFMTRNPIIISSDATVGGAAKLMMKKDVGSLLVIDDEKLLGIITERDIVFKVVSKNKHPEKIFVRDIMSKGVIAIKPNTTLYTAAKIMTSEDIRRLPVVEGGKLAGLVTERDILKIEPSVIDIITHKLAVKGSRGVCNNCGAQIQ